jgi:hypothetical protein
MSALVSVEVILAALVVLSAVGIGITDVSPGYGFWYWLAMVPLFGAASSFTAWSRNRQAGGTGSSVVRTQVLHWVAVLAALYVVFVLLRAGRMNNEAAGLVALLTLALATFLAGVHGDWRFCLVGTLLGLIVGAAAFVQRFLWMILVPLAVILALALVWWSRGRKG